MVKNPELFTNPIMVPTGIDGCIYTYGQIDKDNNVAYLTDTDFVHNGEEYQFCTTIGNLINDFIDNRPLPDKGNKLVIIAIDINALNISYTYSHIAFSSVNNILDSTITDYYINKKTLPDNITKSSIIPVDYIPSVIFPKEWNTATLYTDERSGQYLNPTDIVLEYSVLNYYTVALRYKYNDNTYTDFNSLITDNEDNLTEGKINLFKSIVGRHVVNSLTKELNGYVIIPDAHFAIDLEFTTLVDGSPLIRTLPNNQYDFNLIHYNSTGTKDKDVRHFYLMEYRHQLDTILRDIITNPDDELVKYCTTVNITHSQYRYSKFNYLPLLQVSFLAYTRLLVNNLTMQYGIITGDLMYVKITDVIDYIIEHTEYHLYVAPNGIPYIKHTSKHTISKLPKSIIEDTDIYPDYNIVNQYTTLPDDTVPLTHSLLDTLITDDNISPYIEPHQLSYLIRYQSQYHSAHAIYFAKGKNRVISNLSLGTYHSTLLTPIGLDNDTDKIHYTVLPSVVNNVLSNTDIDISINRIRRLIDNPNITIIYSNYLNTIYYYPNQ